MLPAAPPPLLPPVELTVLVPDALVEVTELLKASQKGK